MEREETCFYILKRKKGCIYFDVVCGWQWKGQKQVFTFCKERKVTFILMWFVFGDGKGKNTWVCFVEKDFFFFFWL
jgi:hypothetical protein